MTFDRVHHVQLAMPAGKEHAARDFYGGVLEMVEIDKPPVLAQRGGAWFRAGTSSCIWVSRMISDRRARLTPDC